MNLFTDKLSKILVSIGFILLIAAIFSFFWKEQILSGVKINAEKFGQFGDFVGGIIGTFWALAGVILFYVALQEQRRDFSLNREVFTLQVEALNQQIEEFKMQRAEMESSRKIYEEQSKTLRLQQFESNFYSLVNVYLTIKHQLNSLSPSHDYFRDLYDKIQIQYDPAKPYEFHNQQMVSKYMEIFNDHRSQLSQYFKCIYRIIKIIDSQNKFDHNEKLSYVKILRSQLTDFEQLLLYYNSQCVFGDKARPLILRYNFLKHVPIFQKPEFRFYSKVQPGLELVLFCNWLDSFLRQHLSNHYELESDIEKIEESCEYFKSIVGIYFDDQITVDVILTKNLKFHNIQIDENEFLNLLYLFICDRVIYSVYLTPKNVNITTYKTDTNDSKILGIKIQTDEKIPLNND